MIAARATLCGQLRLSAASALVLHRDSLWTVADDCLDLHRYDLEGRWLGQWPLLPGVLPEDPVVRKECKADFEAMALLPDGTLLVLGSGSTARRQRGALFGEDQQIKPIDASALAYGNLLLVADADDPAVPAPLFRLDGAWLEEDPAADV